MIIYIVTFLISALLISMAEKTKSSKVTKKVLIIIALGLPILLAGMRDSSIGTDTEAYLLPMHEIAINSSSLSNYYNSSWKRAWYTRSVSSIEIGFSLTVYILSIIFKNLQITMLFIEMLIIIPVYLGLTKFKELNNKKAISMLIYYLLFYNIGLNAIRQMISISFIFLASSHLINDNNRKKFFFYTLIAFLFHTSSIMAIIIYFLYRILKSEQKTISKNSISFKQLLSILIILVIVFTIYNSSIITSLLGILGLEKYSNYISGDVHLVSSTLMKFIPILFLYILCKNKNKIDNKTFYLTMFIIYFLIIQFSSVNIYSKRIGYIFEIFNIVFFNYIISASKYKFLYTILIITLVSFNWYYYFVLNNNGATVPYLFFFE